MKEKIIEFVDTFIKHLRNPGFVNYESREDFIEKLDEVIEYENTLLRIKIGDKVGDLTITQNENKKISTTLRGAIPTYNFLIDISQLRIIGFNFSLQNERASVTHLMKDYRHSHMSNGWNNILNHDSLSSFCTAGSNLSGYVDSVFYREVNKWLNNEPLQQGITISSLMMSLITLTMNILTVESIAGKPYKKMAYLLSGSSITHSDNIDNWAVEKICKKLASMENLRLDFKYEPRKDWVLLENQRFENILQELCMILKDDQELSKYVSIANEEGKPVFFHQDFETIEEVETYMEEKNKFVRYIWENKVCDGEIVFEEEPDKEDMIFTFVCKDTRERIVEKINQLISKSKYNEIEF